jgi:HlyD family secretion protein
MTGRLPVRALLLLALLMTGCGRTEEDAALQGYVEGDYLRLAAPDAGWLQTLLVKPGDQVDAGALLFSLEDSRERAALAEATARLAQARSQLADLRLGRRPEELAQIDARLRQALAARDYASGELRRQRELARSHTAAQARLDLAQSSAAEAQAQVTALEAERATARLAARPDQIMAAESAVAAAEAIQAQSDWRLQQRQIKAPRAGLIDDTVREAGEWVPAGGVVVSLLPPEQRKLVFFIPEGRRSAIQPGSLVAVGCTGCPAGLTARISWLASTAEYTPPVIYSVESRDKLVFKVEARPVDATLALAPGQPVDIRLLPAGGVP